MSTYPTGNGNQWPPIALWPGDTKLLFNAEALTAPQASDRVALGMGPYDNVPASLSVELIFSADPGAFEADLQDADTDADANYVDVPGGQLTGVNASFVGRIELVPIKGRFVRLNLKTLTNAVNCTARIVR